MSRMAWEGLNTSRYLTAYTEYIVFVVNYSCFVNAFHCELFIRAHGYGNGVNPRIGSLVFIIYVGVTYRSESMHGNSDVILQQ